jgi:two-component system, cell cycle sensor histidine kinase and response regulator CckA
MEDSSEYSIEKLIQALEDRSREVENLSRELQNARRALDIHASEAQYKLIFQNSPWPIWIYEENSQKIIAVNEAAIRTYGYTREEFLALSIFDLRPPEDFEKLHAHLKRVAESPNVQNLWRHRKKDGTITDVEVRSHPILFEGKKARLVLVYDVTEQKISEEALRLSEERFQLVARATQDAIWDWNVVQDIVLWNEGFEHLFGYKRDEVEPGSASWFNRIHPDDKENVTKSLNRVIEGSQQVWTSEYRFLKKDGSYAYVFDRAFAILNQSGKLLRMIGSMIDISDRKLAEERLTRQKEYFSVLHDTAINLMSRLDLNETLETIVLRMSEITKLPNGFLYLLDPDSNEMKMRVGLGFARPFLGYQVRLGEGVAGKVWETGEAVTVEDYARWPSRLDHSHLTVLKSVIGVPLKSGSRVVGVMGVETVDDFYSFSKEEIELLGAFAQLASLAVDNARLYTASQNELAERVHAEDALRKSEEKFRLLFEESKDVFFMSSTDGRFTDINPAGVALFGYSNKEEMLSIKIDSELFHDPSMRQTYKKLMKEQGYVKDFELQLRRKDGVILTVLETSTAVYDAKENVIAYRGVMRDVTQLKHLQQQLLQWQKIETIGQLAGGVAHDFNNLLMAISGHCEVLEMKMPEGDPLLHDLSEIKKAADTGASLTRQLLAFSRKQVLEPKALDLNRLLTGMKNMVQRLIGEGINLELQFEQKLGTVRVDPNQFEQVILNLSVNARDAMPEGGTLTIETSNTHLTDAFGDSTEQGLNGDYVLIRIMDTGCGMNAETRSRIFEPFYTTKPEGQGTGLGLSTVYGIIHQSDGRIFVDSQPGKGTTFEIYLHCVDLPQEELQRPPAIEGAQTKQTRILLVDDNESILQAVKTFLNLQGYDVTSAHSPLTALDLSKKMCPIDLLITDVVMPNMTGPQLADAVRQSNPNMKVLFLSGYSDDAVMKQGILNQNASFLQKPASMRDLMKRINVLLS